MKQSKLFPCYSIPLRDFLTSKGIRYEIVGIYSKERLAIKHYLKENFVLFLPNLDDRICDTQEYTENLCNALLWTHNECSFKSSECYHYDIWAYSTIFYHIESYNKLRFKNIVNEYKEQDK